MKHTKLPWEIWPNSKSGQICISHHENHSNLQLGQHISQSQKGKNLFIFDEPTTGLQLADVELLLATFQKLLAQGHSLVVIEHNLDLIRCADYIIDLGPEGGDAGGKLIAEGSPEHICEVEASYTAKFLRPYVCKDDKNGPIRVVG